MGSWRGDTIVEVVLAVAIFSMVAVGAVAMMNRGVSVVQRSLEVTLVRSEMKAQAEALRFIHQEYVRGGSDIAQAQWGKVVSEFRQDKPSSFNVSTDGSCPAPGSLANPFVINIAKINHEAEAIITNIITDNSENAQLPYAHIETDGEAAKSYGIWVESVQEDPGQNYVDFYIRSCWSAVGQATPVTLGTIVRLYVPN